jgi:hypothetical protein
VQLGRAWVRRREREHLLRIAWRHWMAVWLEARPGYGSNSFLYSSRAKRSVMPAM